MGGEAGQGGVDLPRASLEVPLPPVPPQGRHDASLRERPAALGAGCDREHREGIGMAQLPEGCQGSGVVLAQGVGLALPRSDRALVCPRDDPDGPRQLAIGSHDPVL
jgi:hypothetical protein